MPGEADARLARPDVLFGSTRPYARYGGRSQVRVILTIVADKIHDMAR